MFPDAELFTPEQKRMIGARLKRRINALSTDDLLSDYLAHFCPSSLGLKDRCVFCNKSYSCDECWRVALLDTLKE